MAAPTVGAVMADVLPYLGVKQSFSEDDLAGKQIAMEDLTGMTAKDAQALLKKEGLTAAISGSGETVTGQIPSPGQTVPGGSQVLLFFGANPGAGNGEGSRFLWHEPSAGQRRRRARWGCTFW